MFVVVRDVLSSLKTQDTTSNKNLSRVRDDADETGTQTELIVSRNAVTQTDSVIIKSRSKSIQCKLFLEKHKSSQTVHYYEDVTTMTEQTFTDGNLIKFFMVVATIRCVLKLCWSLRFLDFQTASGRRESSIAKISSVDEAKFLDPPLILPFK